jgi:hypothetical protein
MNYDEEKFDFLAFVRELEKERSWQDVLRKPPVKTALS